MYALKASFVAFKVDLLAQNVFVARLLYFQDAGSLDDDFLMWSYKVRAQ